MTEPIDTPLQTESVELQATLEIQCLKESDSLLSLGASFGPSATAVEGKSAEVEHEDWAGIYQTVPIPLLALSASGTVTKANPAACDLLAQPEAVLRGSLFAQHVCPQDRPDLEGRMSSSTSAIERAETRLTLPNGEVVPVQVRIRRSSAPLGCLHLALIDWRDQELSVSAERRARAASDVRDQFISMLSHELRTPLTPVLAAASRLCRDPELAPETRELLEMIQRNVAAEARMIDELLDASGILRGQLHVSKDLIELNGLLADCLEVLQDKAARKRVAVHFSPALGEHFARGDASRLRQVFSCLLDNAIKFTPEGGNVQVRSHARDGRLAIELSDSGVGFDPSESSRLFSAFEPLEKGETTSGATVTGGLGLGLSISKGIIELHGGTIAATSRGLGLGSRFVIELPTLDAPDSVRLASKPECREVTEITSVVHRQILLVEDHADTAEIMTMLFEEQGFSVLSFDSVEAALSANLEDIDVVVSDIGLPDGTGMDLVQRIRDRRDIPAIALSGYGMESDVENALRAGFDLHFTKPVDFERLLAAIHSLLESHASLCAAQTLQ